LGHPLAKWPTSPQLKHIVVALVDVEPSLWLGAAFSIALIFCLANIILSVTLSFS
jgi:hypothetical protein